MIFVLLTIYAVIHYTPLLYLTRDRNSDGTILAMYYKGTVALTSGVQAILSGSPDAQTTGYGKGLTLGLIE